MNLTLGFSLVVIAPKAIKVTLPTKLQHPILKRCDKNDYENIMEKIPNNNGEKKGRERIKRAQNIPTRYYHRYNTRQTNTER